MEELIIDCGMRFVCFSRKKLPADIFFFSLSFHLCPVNYQCDNRSGRSCWDIMHMIQLMQRGNILCLLKNQSMRQ